MNWTTIYITGKSDFRDDVRKRLEHSDLTFMPGYIESSSSSVIHDLYWLDEKTDLRAFKESIGSKIVWKYRLEFFDSLEKFIESQQPSNKSNTLTKEELGLIAEIQDITKQQAA